jgi:protein-tyrosine-phosphatase
MPRVLSGIRQATRKVAAFMYGPEPGFSLGMGLGMEQHPPLDPAEQQAKILKRVLSLVIDCLRWRWTQGEGVLIFEVLEKFGNISESQKKLLKRYYDDIRDRAMCFWNEKGTAPDQEKMQVLLGIDPKDRRQVKRGVESLSNKERLGVLSGNLNVHLNMAVFRNYAEDIERLKSIILVYYIYKNRIDNLLDLLSAINVDRLSLIARTANLMLDLGQSSQAQELLLFTLEKMTPQEAFYQFGSTSKNNLLYLLDPLTRLFPGILSDKGLRLLVDRVGKKGSEAEKRQLLIDIGALYSRTQIQNNLFFTDQSSPWLLELGLLIFESRSGGNKAQEDLLLFWKELQKQPADIVQTVSEEIRKRIGSFIPELESLVRLLLNNLGARDDKHLMALRIRAELDRRGIVNQALEEKCLEDPVFSALIPSIIDLARNEPGWLEIAQLFSFPADIEKAHRLQRNPFADLIAELKQSSDDKTRLMIWVAGARRIEFQLSLNQADKWFLMGEVAKLLEKGNLPAAIRGEMEKFYSDCLKRKFASFIGPNGSGEEIPGKLKEIGREMAQVAHKTLAKIREVTTATKRPALTIYILTTAHGFNGERILDNFYKNPVLRAKILQRIKQAGSNYERAVNNLEKLVGKARVDAEMRIIHRAFYQYVDGLQETEGLDRLSAIMQVGQLWVQKGYLEYFSYPLELKIPSGSEPTPETKQQLQQLARQAGEKGWDIILIDHSTVRTVDVIHAGDPPDFEKGRAIARGMEIIGRAFNRVWLYKQNNWDPQGQLKSDRVNIVGLNLYDGKVYNQHLWGKKEEWLKVDDHGRTIMGMEVQKGGQRETATILILEKKQDGQYQLTKANSVYWAAFRAELAGLEGWPATLPSFKYSNLLFVCNANHHRSPTFEILFRKLIREQLGPDAEKIGIASAGLEVDSYLTKHPEKGEMSPRARQMLINRGLRINGFEKTQIDQTIIAGSDLILVMTKREKEALLEKHPAAEGKVKTVKEFLGFPETDHDIPTPAEFSDEVFDQFEKLVLRIIDKTYV